MLPNKSQSHHTCFEIPSKHGSVSFLLKCKPQKSKHAQTGNKSLLALQRAKTIKKNIYSIYIYINVPNCVFFFFYLGFSYHQCSAPHFHSGRNGQPNVGGCSALHGPYYVHKHDLVCTTTGGAGPLLSLEGRIGSNNIVLLRLMKHQILFSVQELWKVKWEMLVWSSVSCRTWDPLCWLVWLWWY